MSNRAWRGMAGRLSMTLRDIARAANGEEVSRYAISREEFLDGRALTTSRRAVR